MNTSAGTLEQIALEVGKSLQTLADELAANGVFNFFESLGLSPPDGFATALSGDLTAGVTAAGSLADRITALETAIESGTVSDIATAGKSLVLAIGDVLAAVKGLADTIQSLSQSFGGLTDAERAEVATFGAEFARRTIDLLLVDLMEARWPLLLGAAELIGIVERVEEPGVADSSVTIPFQRRVVHFERLSLLMSHPQDYMKTVFGWGLATFDGVPLLGKLKEFLEQQVGLSSDLFAPAGLLPVLEVYEFNVAVEDGDNPGDPRGLKLGIRVPAVQDLVEQLPLLDQWDLDFEVKARFVADTGIRIKPPLRLSLAPPTGTADASVTANLARRADAGPLLIVGQTNGSRIEVGSVKAGVVFDAKWDSNTNSASSDPGLVASLSQGRGVISGKGRDGFLGSVIGDKDVEGTFDVVANWSADSGLTLSGGAGLTIKLPTNVTFGPLTLQALSLIVELGDPLRLAAALDLSVMLGPVAITIQGLGGFVAVAFPADDSGNLGRANISAGVQAPTGLGILVNSGPVSGGGFLFFDEPNGRYGGALELSIYSVAVKAFGLIETKVPGVAFSFVIVISAEFTPIQLGFGFTLLGVGGLIGINRSVDSQALGDAVRAGTLNNVLFPTNLINNAPAIISELASLFPATDKHYIFGPLAKLGWGTPALVTGTLGLILEIPGSALTILGTILARLPKPDVPVAVIDMDVAGKLDFPKKHFELDASLAKDSKVAGFTISGDMATRLDWGDRPNFAISMGGFHPQFTPPPGFPPMKRLGIDLGISGNPSVTLQGYMALTSNTAQIGAKLDVYASFGATLTGTIGFDALFVFSPFSFDARLYGGVNVHFIVDFGMTFDGHISGPSPWFIHGEVCVSYIFDSACVGIDKTLGGDPVAPLPSIDPWEGSPAPRTAALADQEVPGLKPAILDSRNWSGRLPAGAVIGVTYVERKQAAVTPVDPVGIATFRQKAVPLDYDISRFAGTTPSRPGKLQIVSVTAGGKAANKSDITDYFAPGQYRKMSNDEALASKPFEQLKAGVELQSAQILLGAARPKPLTYQTIVLDAQGNQVAGAPTTHTLPQRHLDGLWQSTSAARLSARLSGATRFVDITQPRKITDALELFSVTFKATLGLVPGIASAVNRSEAAALLDAQAGTSPFIRQQYQIVGSFMAA